MGGSPGDALSLVEVGFMGLGWGNFKTSLFII